jgi:small subunit ribosomal protein S16
VAVKIRLKRLGKIRAPYYRVVIADSRTKRDGRSIEEIGKYHPTQEPSLISIDSERAQYWLGVGAQPTEQVLALLKITGDWQTFKGLPGTEGTLRVAPPRPDRAALFDAATKLGKGEDVKEGATTAKKKADKKAEPKRSKDVAAKDAVAEGAVAKDSAAEDVAAKDAAAKDAAVKDSAASADEPTDSAEPVAKAEPVDPPAAPVEGSADAKGEA